MLPALRLPDGYILAAPFNNMYDEVMTFKTATAVSWMVDIKELLKESKVQFKSDELIKVSGKPIMVLHAKGNINGNTRHMHIKVKGVY